MENVDNPGGLLDGGREPEGLPYPPNVVVHRLGDARHGDPEFTTTDFLRDLVGGAERSVAAHHIKDLDIHALKAIDDGRDVGAILPQGAQEGAAAVDPIAGVVIVKKNRVVMPYGPVKAAEPVAKPIDPFRAVKTMTRNQCVDHHVQARRDATGGNDTHIHRGRIEVKELSRTSFTKTWGRHFQQVVVGLDYLEVGGDALAFLPGAISPDVRRRAGVPLIGGRRVPEMSDVRLEQRVLQKYGTLSRDL